MEVLWLWLARTVLLVLAIVESAFSCRLLLLIFRNFLEFKISYSDKEAIMKNERLESLTVDIKETMARSKIKSQNIVENAKLIKVSNQGTEGVSGKSASIHGKARSTGTAGSNSGKAFSILKSTWGATKVPRPLMSSNERGAASGTRKL